MPIRYRVDRGVLVLEVACKGFTDIGDALRAAVSDPAARSKMPLLIDVRMKVAGATYEHIQHRVSLSEMRRHFEPRWAIVTGTETVPAGAGRMFAVFSEIEGLEAGLFADKDEAIDWLTAP